MATSRRNLNNYHMDSENPLIEQYYALLEKVARTPSANYLQIAAQQLCDFLQVSCVMISENSAHNPDIAKTVIFLENNTLNENIEYSLKDTPCELVLHGEPIFYSKDIQLSFPNDKDLVELNAVSYAGHPIYNTENMVIGHIAILHNEALLHDRKSILSVLNLLSIRLGPELERKHTEYLLSELASDFNLAKDNEVFDGLVKKISKTLDVDVALIGKLNNSSGKVQIDVISAGNQQSLFPAFSYPLAGSPCEKAIFNPRSPVIHQQGLQDLFPEFELFKQLNSESYIGMCLLNRDKTPIGILGILHSQALHSIDRFKDVISVFSVVVGEELEHLLNSEELEKYKAMTHTSSDCMCLLNLDYQLINANDAYLDHYNIARESIDKTSFEEIHGTEHFNAIRLPALQECLLGKHVNQEFWRTSSTNDRQYIKSTILPYYGKDNAITGFLITDSDISKQKLGGLLNTVQIDILQTINSSSSLHKTLDYINIEVGNLLGSQFISSIFVLDEQGQNIDYISCPNIPDITITDIKLKNTEEILSSKTEDCIFWQKHLTQINLEIYQYSHCIPFKDTNNDIIGYIVVLSSKDETTGFSQQVLRTIRQLTYIAIKNDREEKQLLASKQQYETLYHETPSMFYTIDRNHDIVSINEFGAKSLGYKTNELIGKQIHQIIHSEDRDNCRSVFENNFNQFKPAILEIRKHHKSGNIVYFRLTIKSCDTEDGQFLLIVAEDISEIQKLSVELNYQATHDMMTGLINRIEFERRLDNCIDQCKENYTQHTLCYIDLDQFKIINDSCGHATGDDLLKNISQIILSKVRSRDTLARLGGDEFGLLMEHCTLEQAENIAESIRQSVEDFRFKWMEKPYSISTSMGLIEINQNTSSKEEILRHVDTACYVAKENGRNRIHIYSDDDKDYQRHTGDMQWVSEINHALYYNHFLLFQQRISNIQKTGQDREYQEILIRLKNENNEIIAPGMFLPAAERFHLSSKIDAWVIETLFKYISEAKNSSNNTYFINLSGQSIGQEKFLDLIKDLKLTYQIEPSTICFEITETAAINNLNHAIKFINNLKDNGCLFALDDFGSGLSSFSYLKNLPVDFVKIDGSFIQNICDDDIDLDMVKSITDIVHKMGKVVIAEFVETEPVMRKLKEIGVDYAQGYLLDKPSAYID